ncbi:MAG: ATP-dependent RNA helicase RhlE [uncultured Sulfurovum sp.]|uniref:ATP-dependent RNA helicase RhlE n=1 Tax=uncultured Sulfurovum sp. TaxID=269237 RepID=A0A6S6SVB4_9BACT|nr:MAG: ATP-dependent RNA helicase RhlE [uncultured Sulfurovum sp.]
MKNVDIIGASKSGTGKTVSYVLPILNKLQKIVKLDNKVVRALVIVPTIELCDQVSKTFMEYGKHLDIKVAKVQGGTPKSIQLERLKKGTDIVVATPGRLQDFISDKKINLENVNTIVLDEADTMLELGFVNEIKGILNACGKPRQIMMFSATISQNIKRLGKEFLREPAIIEVSDRRDLVNAIKHRAYKVDKKRKEEIAGQLIQDLNIQQLIVFTNTKESANKLFEYLKSKKIRVAIIHGDRTRGERAKALGLLRAEKTQVLVATDIAARGVDIQELPFVMNFDIPEKTDDYTHRVGRTGRANHKGAVISLLTIQDYNQFTQIEKDLKMNVKREVYTGFELTDKQPRQKRPIKKTLREKKGYIDYDKKRKHTYAAQKKKRDEKKKDNDRRKGSGKK